MGDHFLVEGAGAGVEAGGGAGLETMAHVTAGQDGDAAAGLVGGGADGFAQGDQTRVTVGVQAQHQGGFVPLGLD